MVGQLERRGAREGEEVAPLALPGRELGALALTVEVRVVGEFAVEGRVQQDLGYDHALVDSCFEEA